MYLFQFLSTVHAKVANSNPTNYIFLRSAINTLSIEHVKSPFFQNLKIGLECLLKVSRNAGFKSLVCCSSPMVEAMCTKFSHVLHQFLTFQSIHCASSQQLSFLPF